MSTVRLYTSFRYALALVGIAVSGLALSMYLTTDTRWMQWHLSRLGEGGHLSSAVFNFTMGVIAVLLVVISGRLTDELLRVRNYPRVRILHALFIIAAIMCVGVACFPFDTFPTIHRIFGHTSALALVLCMIGLPWLYPYFPRRIYYVGVASALFVAGLFTVYSTTGKVALLFVELVGQFLLFVWLLALTHEVRALKPKS
jgi:hypothetical membrane protein